jgi:hypothetical protein
MPMLRGFFNGGAILGTGLCVVVALEKPAGRALKFFSLSSFGGEGWGEEAV